MIPKKIHYIWIGPYTDNRTFVDEWASVMPDYEVIRWDNHTSKQYIEETISLFGGLENLHKTTFAFISDVIRLLVLRDHGGIYLDHDILLLKDLSELLNDKSLAMTFQYDAKNKESPNTWGIGDRLADFKPAMWANALYNTDTVNNCFIASTPDHPAISRMIELIVENHFKPKEEQYPMSDWGVGPSVASAACREFGLNIDDSITVEHNDMVVFERQLLHAVHGTERAVIGSDEYYNRIDQLKMANECYAIHMHDNCGSDLYMSGNLVFFNDWYLSYNK